MQRSPKAHQRQTPLDSRHDARRVGIPHLTQRIGRCAGLLAGLLVLLPGSAPVLAAPPGHEGIQRIQVATAGSGSIDAGTVLLGHQEVAHGSGNQVVVFADVAAQSESVTNQGARQESQRLAHDAPIDHEAKKVTWVGHAISLLVYFLLGVGLSYGLAIHRDRVREKRHAYWKFIRALPNDEQEALFTNPDGSVKSCGAVRKQVLAMMKEAGSCKA